MSATRLAPLKARGAKIDDKLVVLKKPQQDQLKSAKKPSAETNLKTLENLKALLKEHYSPEMVNKELLYIFGQDNMTELEAHVRQEGIKGYEIDDLVDRLYAVRKSVVMGDLETHGAEFHEMMKSELMEEVDWPSKLKPADKELVAEKVLEVIDEFAKISGGDADLFKGFLGQKFAETAAALKKSGAGKQINETLTLQVAELKAAMVEQAVEAAVNGKNSMGDMARALAPKLQDGTNDFARTERQARLGMVQDMVGQMHTTPVKVTLDGKPRQVSLADVFAHENPVWPKLSEADRATVIDAFKALHAETHGYPDKVVINRGADSDAMLFDRKNNTHQFDLTDRTFASDDTRHVLKILAHELTHAYQATLISGENKFKGSIPPEVIARYDFESTARFFTVNDTRVTDFATQQNNYARNYMERASIESEHAALRLLSPDPPNLTQLIEETAELQNGGAGEIRTREWAESVTTNQKLAEEAETPTQKAHYLAEGAGVALELARVDGRNFLEIAGPMLDAIDFSELSKPDTARISEQVVKSLKELFDRVRSGPEERAFAEAHFVKFQTALVASTTDPELRTDTFELARKVLNKQINQAADPSVKVDLIRNRSELRLHNGDDAKETIRGVGWDAGKMNELANGSKDKGLLTKTIDYLTDLEAQLRPLAGKDTTLNAKVDEIKAAHEALSQQLKSL